MKFDEIFPKEYFPLRASTILHFPEHNTQVEIETFYERPYYDEHLQNCGKKITFTRHNITLTPLIYKHSFGEMRQVFVYVNKEWQDATDQTGVAKAFNSRIIELLGENWSEMLSERLSTACWKPI